MKNRAKKTPMEQDADASPDWEMFVATAVASGSIALA